MRTRLIAVLAVLSASGLLLAAQLGAFDTEETRPIPLTGVYATFTQEGLKSAEETADGESLAQALSAIREAPQQIVLCVGEDIIAAAKSSAGSFAMPDDPVPVVLGATSDTLWVAAYLGSDGSVPPAFRIRAVEVTGKKIRVAYERDESLVRTSDLRAYMVWAPVGNVEPGAFTLELFDVTAARVTLARSWHVAAK